jgi:hypothetical protein
MTLPLLVRISIVLLALGARSAEAQSTYPAAVEKVARRRAALAARVAAQGDDEAGRVDRVAAEITASVAELARHWLGTRWGLGPPQTSVPGLGKVNCGTFVGRILHDAGFRVDVARLQRLPSQLIIRSFVGPERTKRWSNAPMERFLADLRKMGSGLFIIGLDFHVGLLIQTDDDLRFVHASYVTGTVVDEPARTARPIADSAYRVVGKLLDARNVHDWLEGRPIATVPYRAR